MDEILGLLSLSLLTMAAALLTVFEARKYRDRGGLAHAYWAGGLALVVATLALEIVFYAGLWSTALMQAYLFLVAALVGLLSLGSAEVALKGRVRSGYAYFILGAIAFTLVAVVLEPPTPDILMGGVVVGAPPLLVTLASSIVTFPAAALMAGGALYAAFHDHRWRAAWTAAGILVISAAGTLYIAAVPVTLYYAEFLGVLLLFVGFGGFAARAPAPAVSRATSGGA